MVISLTIIHVLMCFAIIGIVLLQAGKGADIGSAFGGAGSQAVFGSMGPPTLLGKITTSVAILFRPLDAGALGARSVDSHRARAALGAQGEVGGPGAVAHAARRRGRIRRVRARRLLG